MPTSRTFDTTSPGKDFGEMKIFPRSPESERLMLVKAIIQATSLVNKYARKKTTNGKTPLEESQEKLASTKQANKRLSEVRRMGQTIFSPHIMHNRWNTKYSDIFLTTYWKAERLQPLYDSGTPQQSNTDKEMEITIATNIQDDEANDYLSKRDQLDESIDDESMRSYDFDNNKSMTRQEELFATSQIIRQLQEANNVNKPSVTSTK
jgi:hypothetical protein